MWAPCPAYRCHMVDLFNVDGFMLCCRLCRFNVLSYCCSFGNIL
jgi:hypothetical protein